MKIRKREFEIFNLSFLDIISCGFGAVVMLVLISKNAEDIAPVIHDRTRDLLEAVVSLQNEVALLSEEVLRQSGKNRAAAEHKNRLSATAAQLSGRVSEKERQEEELAASVENLNLAQETLKRAVTGQQENDNVRDEEVGGIPVDSDHVIFIIDTSGSMKQIWRRVSDTVLNVLDVHPQVKGFQVLNDLGKPLISGYEGKWIPDTPQRRKSVIKVFKRWSDVSNSSPVEGVQVALKKYAKPAISTSIYVFGDDYTGASYDPVIERITKLNHDKINAKRLAKIHAVGFISPNTTDRFAILMREMTRRNGGTFLALPQ